MVDLGAKLKARKDELMAVAKRDGLPPAKTVAVDAPAPAASKAAPKPVAKPAAKAPAKRAAAPKKKAA